jgi:hypothetical protein
MLMEKEIQALVHNKQMKRSFVHYLKILNRPACVRVIDRKGQFNRLIHTRRVRPQFHIESILDEINHASDQFHPASAAASRESCADIRVHGADIVERQCFNLTLGATEQNRQKNQRKHFRTSNPCLPCEMATGDR